MSSNPCTPRFSIYNMILLRIFCEDIKKLVCLPVMFRFVRTIDGEVEVARLLGGERGKFDVELSNMGTGDFLIETLG